MRSTAFLAAFVALTIPGMAQATLGIIDNTTSMFTSRGSSPVANFNPVTVWNRIDREKYAGWGHSDANPGFREVLGIRCRLQDQDIATVANFSVVFFTEDPAMPDHPLVTAPIATVGPLAFAAPGSGGVANELTIFFGAPVLLPAGGDAFVGIALHDAFNAAFTDGLSVHGAGGAPFSGTGDLPGGSAPIGLTFGGFYEATTQTVAYPSPLARQWMIDPILRVGGVALVQHYGDAMHAAANTPPGTGCMFSSQYPDSVSPPRNAGRADDIAMSWASGVPDGTPVFFLADVALGFGPEVPLSLYAPGSTGALCLNPGSLTVLGFAPTQFGLAYYQIVWGPAVRPFLAGLPLVQQGIAFDAANGRFHAGPAQISIL